jgi:hypothetical protein
MSALHFSRLATDTLLGIFDLESQSGLILRDCRLHLNDDDNGDREAAP